MYNRGINPSGLSSLNPLIVQGSRVNKIVTSELLCEEFDCFINEDGKYEQSKDPQIS